MPFPFFWEAARRSSLHDTNNGKVVQFAGYRTTYALMYIYCYADVLPSPFIIINWTTTGKRISENTNPKTILYSLTFNFGRFVVCWHSFYIKVTKLPLIKWGRFFLPSHKIIQVIPSIWVVQVIPSIWDICFLLTCILVFTFSSLWLWDKWNGWTQSLDLR